MFDIQGYRERRQRDEQIGAQQFPEQRHPQEPAPDALAIPRGCTTFHRLQGCHWLSGKNRDCVAPLLLSDPVGLVLRDLQEHCKVIPYTLPLDQAVALPWSRIRIFTVHL
jgi:hypothetical protein